MNDEQPPGFEVMPYEADPRLVVLTFPRDRTSYKGWDVLVRVAARSRKEWSEGLSPFPPDMTGVVFTTRPANRFEVAAEEHLSALVGLLKYFARRGAPLVLLGTAWNSVILLRLVRALSLFLPVDTLGEAAELCLLLVGARDGAEDHEQYHRNGQAEHQPDRLPPRQPGLTGHELAERGPRRRGGKCFPGSAHPAATSSPSWR